ncbi:hypothetical protein [Variovorax ginsengisoli]|uniref:Deoxynucleotide monophosphate kinase n=1 Tax=Variovorax ginsengisoli TaxID=363844 RepID=A0ABT9SE56_9BURK|nr:hypothetical protein [Variovorax ginsengisoli]MDP9902637.1 hypothetical protein [Variovorax ginsengisoli]
MRKKQVIGLSGFSGSGKDTVADLLVVHCHFRKLAFADALRGEIANAFEIDIATLSAPETKHEPTPMLAMSRAPMEFLSAITHALGVHSCGISAADYLAWIEKPRTPREIMQWWGTEYRRARTPNYWSHKLLQRIFDHTKDGESRFVVTDCRYMNEVQSVRMLSGVLWQINRPGIDTSNTPEGVHSSATDGSEFGPDLVLNNSHTIAHLQQLVLSEFLARETGIPGMTVTVPA